MLSAYGKVAVTDICFYAPLLFANLAISKTRGFDRRTAWIFLESLAVIRIIGAAIQLQAEKTPRKPLVTVAAIASSVGIAPLLLFTNWQLRRMHGETAIPRKVSHHFFSVVYALVLVGVVLAIIGGATATYSPIKPFHTQASSKAAIVILMAVFVTLVILNIFTLIEYPHLPEGDRIPLLAVTTGIPFFSSRLAYSCVAAYTTFKTFNPISGSVWVLAFMDVLQEFIVVILYFIACIMTPRADAERKDSFVDHEAKFSRGSNEGLNPAGGEETRNGSVAKSGTEKTTPRDGQIGSDAGSSASEKAKVNAVSETPVQDGLEVGHGREGANHEECSLNDGTLNTNFQNEKASGADVQVPEDRRNVNNPGVVIKKYEAPISIDEAYRGDSGTDAGVEVAGEAHRKIQSALK